MLIRRALRGGLFNAPAGTHLTPTITTSALPDAQAGVPYAQTIETYGVAPFTYAVTTGALPTGLSLNAATGEISGTPVTDGSASFTITVTDRYDATDTQAYTFDIDWTVAGLIDYYKTESKAPIYFPFTEAAGATTLVNQGHSGATYNGTATNVTLGASDPLGDQQSAIMARSPQSRVTVSSFELPAKFTILMLFKVNTVAKYDTLVCKYPDEPRNTDQLLRYNSNGTTTAVFATLNSSGGLVTVIAADGVFITDEWHVIGLTFDNTGDRKIRIYKSASGSMGLVNTSSAMTGTYLPTTGLMLGHDDIERHLDGQISEIVVFSDVLPQDELDVFASEWLPTEAETYSLSALAGDPAFDADDLSTEERTYYDALWDVYGVEAHNSAMYTNPVTYATFNPAYFQDGLDANKSYQYAIGYGLRSHLFALVAAFSKTGDTAFLDRAKVWMDFITVEDIGYAEGSGLWESMNLCALSLYALVMHANRGLSTTYATEADTWLGVIEDRLDTYSGAISYTTFTHSYASAVFTAFALYMITGDAARLAQARVLRGVIRTDIAALSSGDVLRWNFGIPLSVATANGTDHAAQVNYARYFLEVVTILKLLGFSVVTDFDKLLNTFLASIDEDGYGSILIDGTGDAETNIWGVSNFLFAAKFAAASANRTEFISRASAPQNYDPAVMAFIPAGRLFISA